MFTFELPQIHDFLKAISVLTETFDDSFDLKFSPAIFSIMAAASPSSRCVIALQLSPQIFTTYVCPKLYYKFIFFETFCDTMQECERTGFSSLTFSFQEIDHDAKLASIPGCDKKVDVPLLPSTEEMDVGEFDFGTFVSIESQEFINIIKRLSDFDYVLVTLSISQVKFSYGRKAIILTQEACKLLSV
uniref:Uncharacterized protein n=1 Tax=Cucumis melo TaxID=3656 RepID=A0A9I9EKT7_CUCME